MPAYKMDVHTHSLVSGHSYNTIREMAQYAAEIGMELLGITDHGPMIPGTLCTDMYFGKVDIIPRKMYGIDVMFGSEVNILDYEGTLDLPEKPLRKLDLCIAGIHHHCYTHGTMEENTNAVVSAMKNPYVDIISHPNDANCPLDYQILARTAAEEHVLLEVNNHSLEYPGSRKNTDGCLREMLKYCRKEGIPVLVSSDAHIDVAIGTFESAEKLLREENFPAELVINNDIPAFKKFLSDNRTRRKAR